jgi:nucleotide-binding universal stress UspA family protein
MANTRAVTSMVVGVDGTADSLAALAWAAAAATDSERKIVVVFVRHVASVVTAASGMEADAEVVAERTLDEIERSTRARVGEMLAGTAVAWSFDVRSGDPASELIAAAEASQADTIVAGGRNHGVIGGLVLGSVAQKLVRNSPVSVMVVRDGSPHRLDPGLAGAPR